MRNSLTRNEPLQPFKCNYDIVIRDGTHTVVLAYNQVSAFAMGPISNCFYGYHRDSFEFQSQVTFQMFL